MSGPFRGSGWQQAQPPPQVDLIDWASLDGLEPPSRKWVIDKLIPCRQVSGIWGVGGVGKPMLAQQMTTCIALGRGFLGMKTNGQPVLYVRDVDRMILACFVLGCRPARWRSGCTAGSVREQHPPRRDRHPAIVAGTRTSTR